MRNTPRVDIDEIAVERAISGDTMPDLNYAERQQVVAALAPRGMSDQQIADRLALTGAAVFQIRQTLKLESRVSA